MIACFTGKPGAGKTLAMMHFLAEDLIRTERHCVTNIPVIRDELAAFLEYECERRKLYVPDLARRLTVIDTEEALYFWRFRPGGLVLDRWDGKSTDGKLISEEDLLIQSRHYWRPIGDKPEYSVPVSYYISEAHRYFNAKRFQRISIIAELYVTHHRHLHDEVYFDTQYPKQLAVACRELIEEWHVLRNDYRRSVGPLRMIPRIRMKSYYEIPSSKTLAFQSRSLHIREHGVAQCYESTGALGTIERADNVESKKPGRGLDVRWFAVIVVLLLTLGGYVLAKGPRLLMTALLGGGEPSHEINAISDAAEASGIPESTVPPRRTPPRVPESVCRHPSYVRMTANV